MTRASDMAGIPVIDEIAETRAWQRAAALRVLAGGAGDAGELRGWAEMLGIPLERPEKQEKSPKGKRK